MLFPSTWVPGIFAAQDFWTFAPGSNHLIHVTLNSNRPAGVNDLFYR
jgi:hypothetical protein